MKIDDLFEGVSLNQEDFEYWLNTTRHKDFKASDVDLRLFTRKAADLARSLKGSMNLLYRSISVFSGDDPTKIVESKKNHMGTSWVAEKGSEISFRNKNPFDDDWSLSAMVPITSIDMFTTLALNMIPVRGEFEREIRLHHKAPLTIVNMENRDTGDNIRITIRAKTKA